MALAHAVCWDLLDRLNVAKRGSDPNNACDGKTDQLQVWRNWWFNAIFRKVSDRRSSSTVEPTILVKAHHIALRLCQIHFEHLWHKQSTRTTVPLPTTELGLLVNTYEKELIGTFSTANWWSQATCTVPELFNVATKPQAIHFPKTCGAHVKLCTVTQRRIATRFEAATIARTESPCSGSQHQMFVAFLTVLES